MQPFPDSPHTPRVQRGAAAARLHPPAGRPRRNVVRRRGGKVQRPLRRRRPPQRLAQVEAADASVARIQGRFVKMGCGRGFVKCQMTFFFTAQGCDCGPRVWAVEEGLRPAGGEARQVQAGALGQAGHRGLGRQ